MKMEIIQKLTNIKEQSFPGGGGAFPGGGGAFPGGGGTFPGGGGAFPGGGGAFPGGTTTPHNFTIDATSESTSALAIIGRPLASIPVNLDGITKSAMPIF